MDIYTRVVLLSWMWFFAIGIIDILLKAPTNKYPWLSTVMDGWALLNVIGISALITRFIANL